MLTILFFAVDKASLRLQAKAVSAALEQDVLIGSDFDIFRLLISLPEFLSAKRVFSYFSIGREVSTKLINTFCLQSGKTLALPCNMANGEMSFGLYDGDPKNLTAEAYGIMCPGSSCERLFPQEDDLIIVPCLCCDRERFRLGHGGGYYDRLLARSKAFSVCLCRDALVFEAVPRDAHDIPVHCLISEKGVIL